jgi:hypothetical protein
VRSGGGISIESNVEVMSDFKGPLIDKEGKLYIDEEYDQTYKKRLRNLEIQLIQQYIQSNNSFDTIGHRQREIEYDIIDKYLNKLKYFSKYPQEIRKELIHGCEGDQLRLYNCGDVIFKQGDDSQQYLHIILRGSVKAILTK